MSSGDGIWSLGKNLGTNRLRFIFIVILLTGAGAVIGYSYNQPSVPSPSPNEVSNNTTPEQTPVEPKEANATEIQQEIHRLVNEEREAHNQSPLVWDAELHAIAINHSKDMAQNDFFSHTGSNGSSIADRYDEADYHCRQRVDDERWASGGENIAHTYFDTRIQSGGAIVRYTNSTAVANGVLQQWLRNDEQRQTLLADYWENIGVGVVVTSNDEVYVTQNFC